MQVSERGQVTIPQAMRERFGLLPHSEVEFVVHTIVALTPLNTEDAVLRTLEAHETGVALLLTTHKERAELYREQFQSKGLTVTIEPAS